MRTTGPAFSSSASDSFGPSSLASVKAGALSPTFGGSVAARTPMDAGASRVRTTRRRCIGSITDRPPIRLHVQLLDPPDVPPALERRLEPRLHDRGRLLPGQEPFADRDHVGVVVRSGETRGLDAPAERAPHALHAI